MPQEQPPSGLQGRRPLSSFCNDTPLLVQSAGQPMNSHRPLPRVRHVTHVHTLHTHTCPKLQTRVHPEVGQTGIPWVKLSGQFEKCWLVEATAAFAPHVADNDERKLDAGHMGSSRTKATRPRVNTSSHPTDVDQKHHWVCSSTVRRDAQRLLTTVNATSHMITCQDGIQSSVCGKLGTLH